MENGHSQKDGFQDQLSLNTGQKYCRIVQGEHSAILLTFNKLPFVIKIFVLSLFEWPFFVVHILGQKCILGQTLNMLALA